MEPQTKTCVRCGSVPPIEDPWHRGVGALSRTDNTTMVCSKCGRDEAMEDFRFYQEKVGSGPTPQSQWPLDR